LDSEGKLAVKNATPPPNPEVMGKATKAFCIPSLVPELVMI